MADIVLERMLSAVVTTTTTTTTEGDPRICEVGGKGQWLPLGGDAEANLNPRVKLVLYFFGLIYTFLGVSIVADMFMAAIERITSVQKNTQVWGSSRFRTSPVWNETVANLTLMALGSSAPEILLSLNDILKRTFKVGKLGASTIVGSAAFNLFCIIAVCINSIPSGEVRYIKETGVYGITAVFSIAAYLWLLVICSVYSPDVVDLWEGVVTFLFFPVLVVLSYYADIGVLTIENVKNKISPPKNEEDMIQPKTYIEKFKAAHAAEYEQEDEEAMAEKRRLEEAAKAAAAMKAARAARRRKGCLDRCLRRKSAAPAGAAPEGDEAAAAQGAASDSADLDEQERQFLADPDLPILDEDGMPIDNDAGIISFTQHSIIVEAGEEEQELAIPLVRKNGTEGKISCSYRMEQLSAIPGFDYEDDEGEVQFRDGITGAEIVVNILPKKAGEKNDKFQLVLEEPEGGAEFNPDYDGGEECSRLTITIVNTIPWTTLSPVVSFLDRFLNNDEMRQGMEVWWEQILEAVYVGGSKEEQENAGFLDWLNHLIWLPWCGLFAIGTPPPAFLGGWVCFVMSLSHIAWLTILIGDVAELFGCTAGIDDNITAISFVALGTSVPDLFASKAAATQDEFADASIVNVTGSNSVNVYLGIGLPWMMASFYWFLKGERFDVVSGDLAFSVVVFTTGALVALAVISLRRHFFEGELGGPDGPKAYSSCLFVLLWLSYIGLSTWKYSTPSAGWGESFMMLGLTIPAIAFIILSFAGLRLILRISKDYIGEEGFWGIFVGITVFSIRALYFVLVQLK
eukprot:TRINITY_DN34767_c0_g1_i3.p1 TRINITY_DN34767_c0_g1~~TRINITY_DN34767_c0_g1_i3.p1  ORF type:complete len:798 (+),score=168.11 TRINITY_DN34767_c0_g1_i3:197-2590(+)